MKQLSILLLSLFIITGCGDDSSSKKTVTTRGGSGSNGGLPGNGSIGGVNGSGGSGGSFSGNSTSTPFAVGKTSGFNDNMRLGLEFYAENQQAVEALGEMEVISASNLGSSQCSLPRGFYDLSTTSTGTIGSFGRVNTNHEYGGITLEGYGSNVGFKAFLHRSLSINLGDDWTLSATLELLSVNGHPCNQYGRGPLYSFGFETK